MMQVEMKWQKPDREGPAWVSGVLYPVQIEICEDGTPKWRHFMKTSVHELRDGELVSYIPSRPSCIPGPPPEGEQGPTDSDLLKEAVMLLDEITRMLPASAWLSHGDFEHAKKIGDEALDFIRRYKESHK